MVVQGVPHREGAQLVLPDIPPEALIGVGHGLSGPGGVHGQGRRGGGVPGVQQHALPGLDRPGAGDLAAGEVGHPGQMVEEVPGPKHLVQALLSVGRLVAVDAHHQYPVLGQQVPGQPEAGVDHVQPVPVGAAAALRAGLHGEAEIARLVPLAAGPGKVLPGEGEVVPVEEMAACVVGGIDVDDLDLAHKGLPEELEDLQVVPLDVQVLCPVKVRALLPAGPEDSRGGRVGGQHGLPLARPCELVALAGLLRHLGADLPGQSAGVQSPPDSGRPAGAGDSLRHSAWKQRRQLAEIFLGPVPGRQLIHGISPLQ